jgi:nucleoside-triphosphatase THEP1
VLLSGPRGCGKTNWCLKLIEQAGRLGLGVQGVVSPAVYKHGSKVAIDLLDLVSGQRRRLAVPLRSRAAGIPVGEWDLDPAVLAWENACLQAVTASPILVIDELGPPEFDQQLGLTAAFKLIDDRQHALTCVTVRPGLLKQAAARWQWGQAFSIHPHQEAG